VKRTAVYVIKKGLTMYAISHYATSKCSHYH